MAKKWPANVWRAKILTYMLWYIQNPSLSTKTDQEIFSKDLTECKKVIFRLKCAHVWLQKVAACIRGYFQYTNDTKESCLYAKQSTVSGTNLHWVVFSWIFCMIICFLPNKPKIIRSDNYAIWNFLKFRTVPLLFVKL